MFVVSRDMIYDLAKQDPEVLEQESTKWVDKSLRALTRPVHKSFSGFVLSLYCISYLHMISKMAKKVKPEMGKPNIILCMKIVSLKISTKKMQRNVNVNVIKFF